MIEIVRATTSREDTVGCIEIMAEHAANGIVFPDREKSIARIWEVINSGFCFIAKSDNVIVGILGLHQFEPWFSKETFLCDVFFYVKPEYRNGEAFKGLIRVARAAGEAMNMPVIIDVTVTPKRKVRHPRSDFERVATRMGFFPVGMILKVGG